MKTNTTVLGCFLSALFAGFAGCALPGESPITHKEGYGVVTVSYDRDLMHKYRRSEVYYWDKDGRKTLIWRYLANQFLHTNDLALFHGCLTTGPDDPGGATRRGVERLFAVQGSGPAVDITDDVVRAWAEKSGTNVAHALKRQAIGSLTKHGGAVQVHIDLWGGGGGDIEFPWSRIAEMISEAKQNGKSIKDPGFGTPYLKRDVEAEVPQ